MVASSGTTAPFSPQVAGGANTSAAFTGRPVPRTARLLDQPDLHLGKQAAPPAALPMRSDRAKIEPETPGESANAEPQTGPL